MTAPRSVKEPTIRLDTFDDLADFQRRECDSPAPDVNGSNPRLRLSHAATEHKKPRTLSATERVGSQAERAQVARSRAERRSPLHRINRPRRNPGAGAQ